MSKEPVIFVVQWMQYSYLINDVSQVTQGFRLWANAIKECNERAQRETTSIFEIYRISGYTEKLICTLFYFYGKLDYAELH